MSYYVEDPFGRIVDVHWKKKDQPPIPPPPPYIGYYGWGFQAGGDLLVPYGPHQYAPNIGTWFSDGSMNYNGTHQTGHILPNPVGGYPQERPTITTTTTTTANGLTLDVNSLYFTNNMLAFLMTQDGIHMGVVWGVPMLHGEILVHWGESYFVLPAVPKTYTLNLEWSGSNPHGGSCGLGISHPLPKKYSTPDGQQPPPEPQIMAGSINGGSFSYSYEYKYLENLFVEVTPENQYDISIGGPVQFWWFVQQTGNPWVGLPDMGGGILYAPGDWFTWEIVPELDPLTNPPVIQFGASRGRVVATPSMVLNRLRRGVE